MCIDFIREVPTPKGKGWKVVRKLSDGSYANYWPVFVKDFNNRSLGHLTTALSTRNKPQRGGCIYHLLVPYTVRHTRTSRTQHSCQMYRTGIHVYRYKETAMQFLATQGNQHYGSFEGVPTVVEVTWEKPLCQDSESVVVKTITITKEVASIK